jgi:hypothetical protein
MQGLPGLKPFTSVSSRVALPGVQVSGTSEFLEEISSAFVPRSPIAHAFGMPCCVCRSQKPVLDRRGCR